MKGLLIPKIRFKGFTDDWEQRKLGEVGSVAMNKRIFKDQTSEDGDVPFYKIGTFGCKPDAYIPRELFEEYKAKYQYPEVGDILISASGSIGRTVEYTGEDEYFQDSNIVWLKHDGRLNNSFLKQFYMVVEWEGLEGSTIKRLYNKNILETQIFLPSLAEQEKVGSFFQQLDNLITLHQRKLDKLKNLKKAYLNKMFPAEDKRKPDLRFKGFTDDWEQRKVSDLGKVYTGNTPSTNKEKYWKENANGFPWITPTDIDNLYVAKGERSLTLAGKNVARVVPENSVLITCIASIGKNAINLNSVAFNQQINAIAPENNDSNFILYFFESDKNKFIQIAGTSATSIINKSMFENYSILAPKLEEQEQIGIIFVKLNNLITLHQRKAECVTKLKISTLIFLMEGDK